MAHRCKTHGILSISVSTTRKARGCRGNSFVYIKEALHLCMDIYMQGFPARFISFIDMQIQVQALQNTKMDSGDYII